MAYEEKRTSYDEATGFEPIFKLVRQVLAKWWLIVVFVAIVCYDSHGVIIHSGSFCELKLLQKLGKKDQNETAQYCILKGSVIVVDPGEFLYEI